MGPPNAMFMHVSADLCYYVTENDSLICAGMDFATTAAVLDGKYSQTHVKYLLMTAHGTAGPPKHRQVLDRPRAATYLIDRAVCDPQQARYHRGKYLWST